MATLERNSHSSNSKMVAGMGTTMAMISAKPKEKEKKPRSKKLRSPAQEKATEKWRLIGELTALEKWIASKQAYLLKQEVLPNYQKVRLGVAMRELQFNLRRCAVAAGWKGPKVFNEETGEFEHAKTGKS